MSRVSPRLHGGGLSQRAGTPTVGSGRAEHRRGMSCRARQGPGVALTSWQAEFVVHPAFAALGRSPRGSHVQSEKTCKRGSNVRIKGHPKHGVSVAMQSLAMREVCEGDLLKTRVTPSTGESYALEHPSRRKTSVCKYEDHPAELMKSVGRVIGCEYY